MAGYRGFPSKAAYEAYYSDPKAYASEVALMEQYAREAEEERIATEAFLATSSETRGE